MKGIIMGNHVLISLIATISFISSTSPAQAQSRPKSGLYQIASGQYVECCGIAGPFHYDLPYERQTYVELNVDSVRDTASMKLLGDDAQTVFRPAWSQQSFTFAFENGVVFSDRIEFNNLFMPAPGSTTYRYVVQFSGDALTINGAARQAICCDIPSEFTHTNVVANFISTSLTIRVSQVEICWQSTAGRSYQLQYSTALAPNSWTNLGAPVAGDGSTKCVKDDIAPQQARRFYRVLTLPQ